MTLHSEWYACSLVCEQDYKGDCEELAHPTIKDMTKLRMTIVRKHHLELVKAYDRMCAES